MKIFRLKNENDTYPYEITIWNPRDELEKNNIPEWLTDRLKCIGHTGINPIYSIDIDKEGNITYNLPQYPYQLHIKVDEVIAKDLFSGLIYPIRIKSFNILYKEVTETNICKKFYNKIKRIISWIKDI